MPEQLLHGAQVGAVLQEMAGESVAQHMRRDFRSRNAGARGKRLQVARKDLPGQVAALGR